MVMGNLKYCPKERLAGWAEDLSREYTVLVPQKAGDAVEFLPFAPGAELSLEAQATAPPKKSVFPQTETLLRFEYHKDPDDPGKQEVKVQETVPDQEKTVVLGGRPCDAKGFTVFDPVFLQGEVLDPYYQGRRNNTLFITQACTQPENTCFCHWVGGGPADTAGSDVLMTPVGSGYVLQALTEQGRQLVDSGGFEDAGPEQTAEADQAFEKAATSLHSAPDLSAVPDRFFELFEDQDFWERMSAKCISCGACTYLCPTCYCFSLSDECSGLQGKRIRTWDNCMSNLFTHEASGHNPRPNKAKRLRNRVGHKFSYYPKLHEQIFACCGCGRCIKSCPMAVDIREIVCAVKEYTDDESLSS